LRVLLHSFVVDLRAGDSIEPTHVSIAHRMNWLNTVGEKAGQLWDNVAKIVAPLPDEGGPQVSRARC
jgi:hypothetical protein